MINSVDPAPLLRIQRLSVTLRVGDDPPIAAVRGVEFDIPENATVALVGESGSGKSMTALAIMGLLPPSAKVDGASAIAYRGEHLLGLPRPAMADIRGKKIAMIFQDPMTSLNPVIRVGKQIAEPLIAHGISSRQDALARAEALLAEVGIPEPGRRLRAFPHELSGGQQQRVMIAIALACEPELLIADEPTTALDVTVQKQVLDLLASLKTKRPMSLLFITHNLDVVANIADRIVVMREGAIVEQGTARQIFTAPREAYTKALLACRPRLDQHYDRLPVIEDLMASSRPRLSQPVSSVEATSPAVVLEVRQLSKSFPIRRGVFRRTRFSAVNSVSFQLVRGKTIGLVGESGSGKSTLAYTMLRLMERDSGEVLFRGQDLFAHSPKEMMSFRRRVQIVFQNPYASLNSRFSVERIVTEPMRIHGIGQSDQERVERAVEMLRKVGLGAEALARYPHEFSGGQRQRIAIARCLTLQPEILVCDEVVSALDVSVQAQVLNLLRDLQDEFQLSYLFISHDLAVVKHMAHEVLVMRDGEVVEQGTSEELFRAPHNAYTQQLLEALPRPWGEVNR